MTLRIIIIQFLYAYCHYADCRISYSNAECLYAECLYGECLYAECLYAECSYAECRGAKEEKKYLRNKQLSLDFYGAETKLKRFISIDM